MMQHHSLLQDNTSQVALLYQQHASTIFRSIRRHICSIEDAEDITLEVSLVAVEQAEMLARLNDNLRLAWLRRVAHNKVVDHYRRSVPGSWSVFARQSPLIVKSAYPSDSPHWFPPKRVNYALSFHNDGGLIYDSWWRSNYGIGTNFPHKDTTGSPANDGSTASINVARNEMAWLYSIAQVNTPVVIY